MTALVGGVAVLAPLVGSVKEREVFEKQGLERSSLPCESSTVINHVIQDSKTKVLEGPSTHQYFQTQDAPVISVTPPALPLSPPADMPARPKVYSNAAPNLDASYRSTLALPPPPLLDANGPPPLAPGWTVRPSMQASYESDMQVHSVPHMYVVRDGDDLTSISIQIYGHPHAASAILAANRDRIQQPDILEIGLSLRIPPPWTIQAASPSGALSLIEPSPGMKRRPVETIQKESNKNPSPWLERSHDG